MMRKPFWTVLVSSLMAVAVSGCGDDESGGGGGGGQPEVDAGADVTADQQSDAPADAASDVSPDVSPDVAPDVAPDVEPDVAPDGTPDAPPPPSGTIQVLTINDFHGQLDAASRKDSASGITTYRGGIGYLSAYFKNERDANPHTIILNGGDEVGATPTLSRYGTDIPDEPTIRSFNFLGVSASAIGNHSFDDGPQHLATLMGIADYAYVGTNVADTTNELPDMVKPYKMLEFGDPANPIKVAVIGIMNPETPKIVIAGNMGQVTIEEPVAAANAAAAQARADGAHVVLVTAHIGLAGTDPDTGKPIGPLMDFVDNLVGVDLVQGGHTDAEVAYVAGNTAILQSGEYGYKYGKAILTVTDGQVTDRVVSEVEVIGKHTASPKSVPVAEPEDGGPTTIPGVCPDDCPDQMTGWTCTSSGQCLIEVAQWDSDADTLLQPWRDHLAQKFDEKIGTIDAVWVRDGSLERQQEVPMGDLTADAILDMYGAPPFNVQIAFMNGGGIRANLPSSYVPQDPSLVRTNCSPTNRCDVVLGDVYTVLPFNNTVVVRTVPGSLLWAMVEYGLTNAVPPDPPHGRFLQLAGIKIVAKRTAPAGARLQSMIYYGGGTDVPITETDTTMYTVAWNNFMNGGGDGYSMLVEDTPTVPQGLISDAVAEYIKKLGDLTTPMPNDRIVWID